MRKVEIIGLKLGVKKKYMENKEKKKAKQDQTRRVV